MPMKILASLLSPPEVQKRLWLLAGVILITYGICGPNNTCIGGATYICPDPCQLMYHSVPEDATITPGSASLASSLDPTFTKRTIPLEDASNCHLCKGVKWYIYSNRMIDIPESQEVDCQEEAF